MSLRALSSIAIVALLVAGCGGGDGSDAEKPRKTGETGGLDVYEVASEGFTIAVPESWEAISVDELDDASLDALAEENPEFAPYLEALDDPDSPNRFFAFDPRVRDEFATNVNVAVESVPANVTFEEYTSVTRRTISDFTTGSVEDSAVELPAGKAQKLRYELELQREGVTQTLLQVQHLLLDDGVGYGITFTTLPRLEAEYTDELAAIVDSFELTE